MRDDTLKNIVAEINSFEKRCQRVEKTDTGDVWELLTDIRDRLRKRLERDKNLEASHTAMLEVLRELYYNCWPASAKLSERMGDAIYQAENL